MQSPFRNRWVHVFLWIVLAVLLLWALPWAAVPPIVKSQLPRVLGEQLGRKVSIGAVDFKPWTLELTARDLTVATADGSAAQAKIDRIYLNAEIVSLLRLAPILDAVHVDDPYLLVTRQADGSLDIDDIRKQISSEPAPEKSANEPFKFALHDIVVQGGAVEFVDRVTDSNHQIQELQLRLPTLSSLDSARETRVEPRLSFQLDGVAFEASGSSTPYADSRSSNGTLTFSGLDVAPYLVYLPDGLPVQPKSARLDAQLQLDYVQTPQPALKISGPVTAHDVAVDDPAGEPLLTLNQLRVTLADLSPLQQQLAVQSVEIDAPRIALRREADGTLGIATSATSADDPSGAATAATATPPTDPAAAESSQPWQLSVQQVAIKDGQLVWLDKTTQPQAQASLRDLQMQASDITYPFKQPAKFDGSATVGERVPQGDTPLTAPIAAAADGTPAGTPLQFTGQATDRSASVQWQLDKLPFALAQPYLAQLLEPTLQGSLTARGAVEWQAATGDAAAADAAQTVLRLDQVVLDQVALANAETSKGDQPLASVGRLELADTRVDLSQRTAEIGKLQIDDPSVRVRRDAEGRWMAQDWLKASAQTDTQAPAETQTQTEPDTAASPAWSVKLSTFALKGGDVAYTDLALAEQPVKAALTQLDVQASNVAYPLTSQAEFKASAQLAAPPGEQPTPVSFTGSASADGGQVAMQLDRLPVGAAEPFLAQFLSPTVSGQATLDAALQWSVPAADAADDKIRLTVRANRFLLEDLALQAGEQAPVRVARVELTDSGADLSSQHVQLGQLQITDPSVDIARNAEGRWMFEDWLKKQSPSTDAAEDEAATPAEKPGAWSFALNDFKLDGGNVSYTDRALAEQPVQAELSKLQLQASKIALPFTEPAQFSGLALLATAKTDKASPLEFKGQATDTQADVDLRLEGLPFAAAQPFYAKFLKPTLSGRATFDGGLQWRAGSADGEKNAGQLTLRANQFVLEDVALQAGEQTPVRLARVELTDSGVDLSSQHVQLGRLQITDPSVDIARNAEGRWMFEDWLKKQLPSSDMAQDKTAAGPEEAGAWSFALNDFKLDGGNVSYTDRALAEQPLQAELSKLQLQASKVALPFTEPAQFSGSALLATAKMDDASPLEFKGQATDAQADVDLRLEGLPFAAARPFYAKFLKPTLSGTVTLDGGVQWRAESADGKKGNSRLTLRADQLTLDDVKLAEGNQRLAGIGKVTVADAAVDLSQQQVRIGKVEVRAPTADVRRTADGRWMFEDWLRTPAGSGSDTAGSNAAAKQKPPAWKVDLAQLSVLDGQVDYADRALAEAPVEARLSKIKLQASKLGLPFNEPARFEGSVLLATDQTADPSRLAFSGSASAAQASVDLKADQLPLTLAQPFYASLLEPTLSGQASIDGTLQWQAAKGADGAAQTVLRAKRMALDDVALTRQDAELARVEQVALTDATLDLNARKVQVGKVQVTDPVATVERDEQGQWMFQRWLKDGNDGPPAASADGVAADPQPAKSAWAVQLANVALAGGQVAFRDRAQPSLVAFDLTRIQVETQNVSLTGTELTPLHVSARINPPAGEGADPAARGDNGGQLDYRGQFSLAPQLQAKGAIDATRIPVHLFEPYFASQLNIEIAQADASFKGDAGYVQSDAGPRMDLSGDLTVQDMRANAVAAAAPAGNTSGGQGSATVADVKDDTQVGDELVNWKTLNLTGLKVAVAPGQATSVALAQTALSDFFARLILYPDGKLNLQGLVKSDGAQTTETADGATASPSQPAALIDIGTTSFVNGRLYFTDLLIKPNYSARLNDLTGKLGAFSSRIPASGQPELAQLELRGSTEQGASIDVNGKLNPLAKPLALDVAGKVRDLELPPFSPYAVKYAGHPIERGKLSMDVNYRIQPNGQMTADNNLVLTQLRFGEKVEDAPNSLPVKLAVALLANSEGVIDLDLPISGSIDDPQFSIADVLGNAVGNLLGKAVTAPFTLLGRAIGGIVDAGGSDGPADALNSVAFAAGTAELSSRARSNLDRVAQALQQRESLQVTIAGTAGNPAEREAWKRAQLQREIEREQLNGNAAPQAGSTDAAPGPADSATPAGDAKASADDQSVASSDDSAAPAAVPLPSSPLRRLYQQSDIPKPRNPDGTDQPLSDKEMETLMLSRIEADDEALRELAVQRGVAVRDYLEGAGLPKSRLFLGAARLSGADQLAEGASNAEAAAGGKSDRYLPHAELDLETR